ncbi:Hypothetical protein CFV354_1578 [Campylobacter fetus subsp. venerealis NCTC 10354]|nr:Hypothetical protein CFV354_1578 [Campylobacter fetus subsp. venerealis NCTC 10354]
MSIFSPLPALQRWVWDFAYFRERFITHAIFFFCTDI